MVDVTDSKSVPGNRVWVRVPPPAPNQEHRIDTECQFGVFCFVYPEWFAGKKDGMLPNAAVLFEWRLEVTNA